MYSGDTHVILMAGQKMEIVILMIINIKQDNIMPLPTFLLLLRTLVINLPTVLGQTTFKDRIYY
jgi:hypothetical protein